MVPPLFAQMHRSVHTHVRYRSLSGLSYFVQRDSSGMTFKNRKLRKLAAIASLSVKCHSLLFPIQACVIVLFKSNCIVILAKEPGEVNLYKNQLLLIFLNVFSIALMVKSMSSLVCAVDRKSPSNWEGGRKIPSSIIDW